MQLSVPVTVHTESPARSRWFSVLLQNTRQPEATRLGEHKIQKEESHPLPHMLALLIGLAWCMLGSLVMVCCLLTQEREGEGGGGSLWLLKATPLHKRCANKELTTPTTKKNRFSAFPEAQFADLKHPRSSAGDQTHFESLCHCRYLPGVLK